MIKALMNGKERLMLGLSEENVKRLKQGDPILFNLKDLGLPTSLEIFIFYGKTEHDMKTDLFRAGLIDPVKTKIKDSGADQN